MLLLQLVYWFVYFMHFYTFIRFETKDRSFFWQNPHVLSRWIPRPLFLFLCFSVSLFLFLFSVSICFCLWVYVSAPTFSIRDCALDTAVNLKLQPESETWVWVCTVELSDICVALWCCSVERCGMWCEMNHQSRIRMQMQNATAAAGSGSFRIDRRLRVSVAACACVYRHRPKRMTLAFCVGN